MERTRSREVICVQSGQAGVQLGHALWELLTVEHGLDSTGLARETSADTSFLTFFSQTADQQYFPRALIFDTEPTVIDEIRCGYYRKLFNPEFLLNGYEDAANNFARGYYTESRAMLHTLVDGIRHMVEHCNNFQGFLVQSSSAGGTGSGLLTSLMEYLVIEFAGRTNIQLSIYPGTKLSNCVVQPYNCILSQDKLVYCANINIIVDNEELYSICSNQLDMKRPSFSNINRVICPILSGLTAPIRFKGMLNSDLSDITTNLIPFPRLHFPFVSYAPLMSEEKSDHDLLDTEFLTRSMFLKENQFVNADLQNGYFMSSAILYRGNCNLSNIIKTIRDIKSDKNLHWVDWCPTGFKISHTPQMPVSMPKHGPSDYDKSAMMLSNHNAIIPTLRSLETPFRILLRKRAYLHWYFAEGMEKSEFESALYEVQTISDDYFNVVDHMFSDVAYSTSVDSIHSLEKNPENSRSKTEKIDKSEVSVKEKSSSVIVDHSTKIKEKANNENDTSSVEIKIDFKFVRTKSNHEANTTNISKPKTLSNNAFAGENVISLDILNDNNTSESKTVNRKVKNNNLSSKTIIPIFGKSRTFNYSSESVLCTKKDSKDFTNNFDDCNNFNSNLNNVSNDIFEICERNYIRNNFNIINKKQILRQYDETENKTNNHFIKKIYLKNKGILQRIRHIQEYDLSKSSMS